MNKIDTITVAGANALAEMVFLVGLTRLNLGRTHGTRMWTRKVLDVPLDFPLCYNFPPLR